MVVGWQTAEHLRTSLVVEALAMAKRHGHVQPEAVFHADRGWPAHLGAVRRVLCPHPGVWTSVGRTGVCWDNAAESFFAMLKSEMSHRQRFDSRARPRSPRSVPASGCLDQRRPYRRVLGQRRRIVLRHAEKRDVSPAELRQPRPAPFPAAEYIEVFYNRQRLHSSLGYRPPAEALAQHQFSTAA